MPLTGAKHRQRLADSSVDYRQAVDSGVAASWAARETGRPTVW